MGQLLSNPITGKSTSENSNERVLYGVSNMQGWRKTMEDAHTTMPCVQDTDASFFAIFDGHGGDSVAKYCSKHLHNHIFQSDAFKQENYKEAIVNAYFGIDDEMLKDVTYAKSIAGCTAVSAMITKDNILYVGNAGDSRLVICRNGKATAITTDHKPEDPEESIRITKAGDYVENGRVNGSLGLSRALGDFRYKAVISLLPSEQSVTAQPDVFEHALTENDQFIVLGCDGIWDCKSNQQVVDFIRKGLCEFKSLGTICEELMDSCLATKPNFSGIGCDNMTIMIVAFLNQRTVQEWYDWMGSSKRV